MDVSCFNKGIIGTPSASAGVEGNNLTGNSESPDVKTESNETLKCSPAFETVGSRVDGLATLMSNTERRFLCP